MTKPPALAVRRWLADRPRMLHAAAGRRCRVCGHRGRAGPPWTLAPELVEGWQIDARWTRLIERREGLACRQCGSVYRYQCLAGVIMEELADGGDGPATFAGFTDSPQFKRLRVAEINGCGPLHGFLNRNPALAYSEYGSEDPAVPSEDLTGLSYGDGEFDLVLTSDTLEHIPDLPGALGEIERVLKPGGRHIFTVPAIWDGRKTRRRARLEGGRIVHLLSPSYHGVWAEQRADRLVFHEFGGDVLDYVRTPGTAVTVKQDADNPAVSIFVAVRLPDDAKS